MINCVKVEVCGISFIKKVVMNVEYSDLKSKDVVNVSDGKKLGKTVDLIVDTVLGKIRGIVVPGDKGFSLFKSTDDLYIPWNNIKRIGSDVILVEVCQEAKTEALQGKIEEEASKT